jgi:ribosome-binding protein aMBF1 (putative translation factor)
MHEITPQEQMKTAVRRSVAASLDDLILAKGWSRQEFSARLDKTPFEIADWLSGTHNFTIDELGQISFMLEIEIADLFR